MPKLHLVSRITANALRPFIFTVALSIICPASASTTEITQDVVEGVMKSKWDKNADSLNAKSILTVNELKLGQAAKATVQEVQVEGIPDKMMVTPAVIDFTVRTYYSNGTQAVRRVRDARIYRDKMGDWAVMTGAVRGQDLTTREPVAK